MTDVESLTFQQWTVGMPTKYAPADEAFLRAALDGGFEPFIHSGGLFGAKSARRGVQVIHRGGGKKWEVIFLEHGVDVVTTMTTELEPMTHTLLGWLAGRTLTAKTDSVRAAAG